MSVPAVRTALTGACLLALFSLPALAGKATMATSDGQEISYEFRDKLLRVNLQDPPDMYMVVRDNTAYMVNYSGGKASVMDLGQTMQMFSGVIGDVGSTPTAGKLVSLDATGRSENVAGVKGEVYTLKHLDQNGRERTAEVVLSKDARARELSAAMVEFGNVMSKAADKTITPEMEEVNRKFREMNVGILRYGNDMVVTSLSDEEVASSRFELPAKPTDLGPLKGMMSGMGDMLKNMGK